MSKDIQDYFKPEEFMENATILRDLIGENLKMVQSEAPDKTLNRISPEEQLEYWRKDFKSETLDNFENFMKKVFSHSINFHSRGYMGHQVSTTLPLCALTSAAISYLNNCTTVYELGMAGNAMERVVISHLAEKYGYDKDSTGIVTSGGSLGNLTALVTARTSLGIDENDYNRIAVMVSEEAHYSIERAAKIMGIKSENVIKIPSNDKFQIRTELLEEAYQKTLREGKIVFCIVGCACTTAVGAYDDLNKLGDFAQNHGLWFHVDAAHGGPSIFSKKYKHYLSGVEKSDSIVVDFHKMMLVPPLSTAIVYNARNRRLSEFCPKASYLWQNELVEEWYNSAKHTFECTKPISILHTYAIMRLYGDSIYEKHIDKLYGLGRYFADKINAESKMELAVEPTGNVVCFRCLAEDGKNDELNRKISDKLLQDGTFYIVNTTIRNKFYLRISIMNPMTGEEDLDKLLAEIKKMRKEVETPALV